MDALLLCDLDVLVTHSLGSLCVDDFMETGKDITSSDPFEHLTSLHKKAALWHLGTHLFPVTGPEEQPWVAGFAVDSDEI